MRLISLKNSSEFDRVFDQGKRISSGRLSIVVAQGNGVTKVGLAVSKRVGGAVIRNRVKRVFREAFRAVAGDIRTPCDIVILPKTLPRDTAAGEVAGDLRAALIKAGLVGTA
jgi:ribonuclease P protein component